MGFLDILKDVGNKTKDFLKLTIEKQKIERERNAKLNVIKKKYLSKLSESELQKIYDYYFPETEKNWPGGSLFEGLEW